MKLWGKTKANNLTLDSRVVTVHAKTAFDVEDWGEPFSRLCHDMDISRPVILNKHIRDLEQFRHTVFLPQDFLENVEFERLEIEVF